MSNSIGAQSPAVVGCVAYLMSPKGRNGKQLKTLKTPIKMTNLLSIESAFLSNSEVKQALNLTEIKRLSTTLSNGQKKKFATTLTLSAVVLKAFEWFGTEECKQLMTIEGISWTTEDFANKVFGWQKSYFYKVVKAGKLDTSVVDRFNTKCDEIEASGEEPNRTLEGLLKFAKAVEEGTEEGGEGEEGEGAEVEVKVPTILTFTFKPEGGKNVAVRIDANGVMKTTNDNNQIFDALQILMGKLAENQN